MRATGQSVLVAGVAVALLGCSEQRQVPAAPTNTSAVAATAAAVQPGSFRLAEAPVVIYTGVPAPDYEFRVYVRLNRPLPRRPRASLALDGQTDLPGAKRMNSSRPCYRADIGITDTAPETFLNPKDGQSMTVSFEARGIGKSLKAKATAKFVDGTDYESENTERRLLRRLGCDR